MGTALASVPTHIRRRRGRQHSQIPDGVKVDETLQVSLRISTAAVKAWDRLVDKLNEIREPESLEYDRTGALEEGVTFIFDEWQKRCSDTHGSVFLRPFEVAEPNHAKRKQTSVRFTADTYYRFRAMGESADATQTSIAEYAIARLAEDVGVHPGRHVRKAAAVPAHLPFPKPRKAGLTD